MKIIDNNNQLIEFNSLSEGDTFKSGDCYYMKTELNSGYNAVDLENGILNYFGSFKTVSKIKGEFHVEYGD